MADLHGRSRVHAVVTGHVQGVGFRWWMRDLAERAGVGGWVQNESDGSVACELEGDADAVDGMLTELRKGPPGASVAGLALSSVAIVGESGFSIRP